MMMTKTRCLMQRMEAAEQPFEDMTCYQMEDDDTGEMLRQVVLSNDDVMDMGGPEFITVTIQPGDYLNPPVAPEPGFVNPMVEDPGRLDMATGHIRHGV